MSLYGSFFVLMSAYKSLCVVLGPYVSSWILISRDGPYWSL